MVALLLDSNQRRVSAEMVEVAPSEWQPEWVGTSNPGLFTDYKPSKLITSGAFSFVP